MRACAWIVEARGRSGWRARFAARQGGNAHADKITRSARASRARRRTSPHGHASAAIVERRRLDAECTEIHSALATMMDFVVDDVEQEVVPDHRVLAERRHRLV